MFGHLRLMSLMIFSPGLFVAFLIVHSLVVAMSQQRSSIKLPYLDPSALTSERAFHIQAARKSFPIETNPLIEAPLFATNPRRETVQ